MLYSWEFWSVLPRDGSAVTTFVPKHNKVSKDGAEWVNVHLVKDLDHQPMCDELDKRIVV